MVEVPGLQSKLQENQDYTEEHCLEKKQNKQIRRFSFFKTATISFKVQIFSKAPELTVDPVKS